MLSSYRGGYSLPILARTFSQFSFFIPEASVSNSGDWTGHTVEGANHE